MNFWNNFAAKHPAAAKWVREGGLFVIVSNLITVFKYLLLQFLPKAFASLPVVDFGWPGMDVTLFGETFKWNILGYDAAHGGLPYFCAYMIAMVIGECINFPIQRNFVFRSKGNLAKQIGWYVLAFCVITCIAFVGMLFLFRPVACRCNSMHFFLRSHLYFMKMPPFRLSGMGAYIRADGGCFKRYGFLCSGFSQRLWQDAQLPPQPSPFQPPCLEIHTTASANRMTRTISVMIPRSVNIFLYLFSGRKGFRIQYTRFCPEGQRKVKRKSVIFLKLGLAFWQRPCYNNHVPVRSARNKIWRISSAG